MARLFVVFVLCLAVPAQAAPWLRLSCCGHNSPPAVSGQVTGHDGCGKTSEATDPNGDLPRPNCQHCPHAVCGAGMPLTPGSLLAVALIPQHGNASGPVTGMRDAPTRQLLRPPIA